MEEHGLELVALHARGVPMTGLTFQPIGHFRTTRTTGRGGALLSTFNMEEFNQTYKDNGFAGPFMMDHTPTMPEGFDSWHGHAYANGYIKALIKTVYG